MDNLTHSYYLVKRLKYRKKENRRTNTDSVIAIEFNCRFLSKKFMMEWFWYWNQSGSYRGNYRYYSQRYAVLLIIGFFFFCPCANSSRKKTQGHPFWGTRRRFLIFNPSAGILAVYRSNKSVLSDETAAGPRRIFRRAPHRNLTVETNRRLVSSVLL